MRGIVRGAAFGLIAACRLTACGGRRRQRRQPADGQQWRQRTARAIVVGSANFPENQLLAEIYAQALEAKGLKVTRKFDIGAREVYYDQVVKGGISVFPEYNGALLAVAVDEKSTATSTEDINAELKAKLPSSVEILDSAAAEDKDSVTVTPETAAKYNLKTLADLKPVAGDMTIGAGSEFKTRTQGVVGLKTRLRRRVREVPAARRGRPEHPARTAEEGHGPGRQPLHHRPRHRRGQAGRA